MNGFGTFIDNSAILEATHVASRDQALRVRDSLRQLIRLIEDMHNLPHSFQTKTEIEREGFYSRQNGSAT